MAKCSKKGASTKHACLSLYWNIWLDCKEGISIIVSQRVSTQTLTREQCLHTVWNAHDCCWAKWETWPPFQPKDLYDLHIRHIWKVVGRKETKRAQTSRTCLLKHKIGEWHIKRITWVLLLHAPFARHSTCTKYCKVKDDSKAMPKVKPATRFWKRKLGFSRNKRYERCLTVAARCKDRPAAKSTILQFDTTDCVGTGKQRLRARKAASCDKICTEMWMQFSNWIYICTKAKLSFENDSERKKTLACETEGAGTENNVVWWQFVKMSSLNEYHRL